MTNKICIKDIVSQITSFWMLRTQIYVEDNIYGEYFDNNGKLLLDKDKVLIKLTISNNPKSERFTICMRNII